MSGLLHPESRKSIENRLRRLEKSNRARFGKLSVDQMLAHCADQLKLAIGEKKGKSQSNIIKRSVAKWFVLYLVGFPKSGVKTIPEMDWEREGTKAEDFEREKAELLRVIREFCIWDQRIAYHPHPYFGRLTTNEWSRVAYLHLDHHLKQFGV